MTWFELLTGFSETSPSQVRQNITVNGESLTSIVNGRAMSHGRLETPSLAELRQRVRASGHSGGRILVRQVVANVQVLHADVSHAGSLFQVASQFNLLEMVNPGATPEEGVGIYESNLMRVSG